MKKRTELAWRRMQGFKRFLERTWTQWDAEPFLPDPEAFAHSRMRHWPATPQLMSPPTLAGGNWIEQAYIGRGDDRTYFVPAGDDEDFGFACAEHVASAFEKSIDELIAEQQMIQGGVSSASLAGDRALILATHRTEMQQAVTAATVEAFYSRPTRACRECGCTQTQACVDERGPCWWVDADLCSHCADPAPTPCPPGDLKPEGYQPNELEADT